MNARNLSEQISHTEFRTASLVVSMPAVVAIITLIVTLVLARRLPWSNLRKLSGTCPLLETGSVEDQASDGRPPLTRDFVSDVGVLAEQLIMYDMPTEEMSGLSADASRERAAPFFPDRFAEVAERPGSADCEVRQRRAAFRMALQERRGMRVEAFIDTDEGTEKAAAVLVWHRGLGDSPTIVVAFRGSKGIRDWLSTNAKFLSPRRRVVELSDAAYASQPDSSATRRVLPTGPTEELHSQLEKDLSPDCVYVPLPVWRAYAGVAGREPVSPRGRIRATVERLLAEIPSPVRIVVCGHSLGGALAQTCALDLLQASPAVFAAGVILLPVASPPAFSSGFQRKLTHLRCSGQLRSLHLTAAGDFAPQLKGSMFKRFQGPCVHGVTQRLVLNPRDPKQPLYYVSDGEDDECADLSTMPFDQFGHNMYAKDLSGQQTLQRPQTIPLEFEWPVPLSV